MIHPTHRREALQAAVPVAVSFVLVVMLWVSPAPEGIKGLANYLPLHTVLEMAAIFGVLHGKVTYVSPDALSEDTRAGEHIYYRVQIKVDTHQPYHPTKGGKKLEIQPGMTVQSEIRTGSMTVLSYIAKPIVKTFTSSFSER